MRPFPLRDAQVTLPFPRSRAIVRMSAPRATQALSSERRFASMSHQTLRCSVRRITPKRLRIVPVRARVPERPLACSNPPSYHQPPDFRESPCLIP